MQKPFDSWNSEKKKINTEKSRFYSVREIWWCRIGINIGTEQDGGNGTFLRPVVILQSFGKDTCLIIPLTTSEHVHRLRVDVGEVGGKNAVALLSQIRTIDTKRLVDKIGFLNKTYFEQLRKTLKDIL